jgi:hypothetical protein
MPMRLGLVVVVLYVLSGVARAQPAPGTPYVFGGAAMVQQPGASGESPQTYVTAPGGRSAGWLVGGGIFVSRRVSIDAEIASTGWMRAREPSRYDITYNEERRDRLLSIGVRMQLPLGPIVRLEPVLGLTFVRPEAWSQSERREFFPPPQGALVVEPRVRHGIRNTFGPSLGIDVRIGGEHAAVLPTFRWAFTGLVGREGDEEDRTPSIDSVFPGGYPDWTFRLGMALRIDF